MSGRLQLRNHSAGESFSLSLQPDMPKREAALLLHLERWRRGHVGTGERPSLALRPTCKEAVSKPFILILEDSFLVAYANRQLLQGAGYRVEMTASAEAALGMARADAPDVAIVDLQLKDGMTGAEAAQHLRGLGCVVILCTGFADTMTDALVKRIRPAAVLSKPTPEHDILAAVKGALGILR